MESIKITTLVDITKPAIVRAGYGSDLEQNQYKNWTTLQQCIGLRSIIDYDNSPNMVSVDIKGLGFGSKYKGVQNVWTFTFYPDRTLSYDDGLGNPIGLLLNDLHQVPIIKKLTETINIFKAVFDLEDPQYKNIVIVLSERE